MMNWAQFPYTDMEWPTIRFQVNKIIEVQHGGKPNDETAACSLQPRGSPIGPPLAHSGNLGEEVAGGHLLLLDALEGISFPSDVVSQLREDNERLRKDHTRIGEQHARIFASLRGEVPCLRDELARRVASKLGEHPAVSNRC
ncbi:hypothetical protein HPB50_012553 [Hyalomma asiaticum]|uniref:Uncharacterized protein n=1 Tax=Hyalomma asiaticum TaxID=266040 RepID=A0ACB7RNS6_HYAAI|nr:hypothetical protein HPB50_012553 [Hyalomma asiaticum]